MSKSNSIELDNIVSQPYKYGFATDIETENFPTGLNESIISQISSKKNEPRFVLEFRLQAYKRWLGMETPDLQN
jgi:Fe-S cluster assembly protein SufB